MIYNQLIADEYNNENSKLESLQSKIWTALPGIIQTVNFSNMTCTVQPTIQGIFYKNNEQGSNSANDIDLPVLVDCPIVFPSGGGCTLTFPINKGDEVLIIFSSRCIDNWWALGATDSEGNTIPRPQAEYRMNDLSDGFVIPGPRSVPRVIPLISTTTVQLRANTKDNTHYSFIEIHPGNFNINISTTGNITANAPNITANASTAMNITSPITTITGNVHITGDVQVDKTLTATTDVIGGSKSLKNHTHTSSSPGSQTSPPT